MGGVVGAGKPMVLPRCFFSKTEGVAFRKRTADQGQISKEPRSRPFLRGPNENRTGGANGIRADLASDGNMPVHSAGRGRQTGVMLNLSVSGAGPKIVADPQA
jgi:hypothetical protein